MKAPDFTHQWSNIKNTVNNTTLLNGLVAKNNELKKNPSETYVKNNLVSFAYFVLRLFHTSMIRIKYSCPFGLVGC